MKKLISFAVGVVGSLLIVLLLKTNIPVDIGLCEGFGCLALLTFYLPLLVIAMTIIVGIVGSCSVSTNRFKSGLITAGFCFLGAILSLVVVYLISQYNYSKNEIPVSPDNVLPTSPL